MGEGTVLVRRRALGDVVLLGAITARVPGPVTVVTDERYTSLAARLRGVDRVVPWGQGRPLGRVVDLQRDLRSLAAFPLARKVRKHSLARRLGLRRPAVAALYARAAGVAPAPPPWIELPEGPRDALALIPGASSPLKAPRPATLVAVGRRWTGPVVVLGGPGETDLVRAVADGIPGAAVVVEEGFEATLRALSSCAVAVGGDTGLRHLAVAAGVRTVALAGPTHPGDGFLRGPLTTVVGRALPCRPCALHRVSRCARGDVACMDHDDEAVWEALCAGSS